MTSRIYSSDPSCEIANGAGEPAPTSAASAVFSGRNGDRPDLKTFSLLYRRSRP